MPRYTRLVLLATSLVLPAASALASANHYGLTISTGSTFNVSFSKGVFTATGDNAVLNVSDLENALAAGNVEVTTDNGSGGDEKGDLHVDAPFSWANGSGLALDAYHSIFVIAAVAANGAGAVVLTINDGGSGGALAFQSGGSLSFANISNSLSIDGVAYTLENSLPTLANAIASKPGGKFALANSYDASQDGNYNGSPITTTMTGFVEGLGNTISNLSIASHPKRQTYIGLISHIGVDGTVENLNVTQLSFKLFSQTSRFVAGGLAGLNEGSVFNDYSSGSIAVGYSAAGGLVGSNAGTLASSRSSVRVKGSKGLSGTNFSVIGGLVDVNTGTITLSSATGSIQGHLAGGLVASNTHGSRTGIISESFATGRITGGDYAALGGLVGSTDGAEIENSYATGVVTGGMNSMVGGGAGADGGNISTSYSTGTVSSSGGSETLVGGFIGDDDYENTTTSSYWDTTTSGTDQGTGNGQIDNGLTGLTSTQLQSGLPDGFDSAIWKQKKGINHGFPFLIQNAPNK